MRARTVLVICLLTACAATLPTAREDAAQRSCQYFSRCGGLGDGGTYPNADECLTQQRAFWANSWPVASCDGRLDGQALEVCLAAIDATQCQNGLDLLATLSKCGAMQVCQ